MRMQNKRLQADKKHKGKRKAAVSRKPLLQVLDGPEAEKQISEALGLVIPCRTGKPDRIKPMQLEQPCSCGSTDHVTVLYQCEQCTRIYQTRKAWAAHAGMVSNVPGNCPGG